MPWLKMGAIGDKTLRSLQSQQLGAETNVCGCDSGEENGANGEDSEDIAGFYILDRKQVGGSESSGDLSDSIACPPKPQRC